MNKRYLPIIASIFILALTASSVMPAVADYVGLPKIARAQPTLRVVTIPEDDETRKTGIMVLGIGPPGSGPGYDLLAQFKVLVSYNGVPVNPDSFICQVIEKDKYNPIKGPQGKWENLMTVPKDMSGSFVCKLRWGKPGVGVIDVYYVGAPLPQFISDYVLVVFFDKVIGRTLIFGTEMQDICVLGWNLGPTVESFTKPSGDKHYVFPDALGNFVSCEDAALYQKHVVLGLPIPWV